MFIAVVGDPRETGFTLFLVGAIRALPPLTLCIFIGRKIFRFSRAETLGRVADSRRGVASVGAVLDALESSPPAADYTVNCATGNLILVFSSLIVMTRV